ICSVVLGDSDAQLVAALFAEYPAASIDLKDPPMSAPLNLWWDEVLKWIAGKTPHADLPVDVQATAFQWQVWEELRRIPRGATRSYPQNAEDIGKHTQA